MRGADLLVLDEPTAALDPKAEAEVYRRFAEHAGARGGEGPGGAGRAGAGRAGAEAPTLGGGSERGAGGAAPTLRSGGEGSAGAASTAQPSGRTAILISHRMGCARLADRILVLKDGTLIEQGTHEELMRQGGEYAHLFATQARWYA